MVKSAEQLLYRRPNGFLKLSLKDRTILFLVILLYKTVSVGDSLCIRSLAYSAYSFILSNIW